MIIKEFKKNKFSKVVNKFYENDYPERYSKLFKKSYKESRFGERFYILILRNKYRNSINSLKEDVGNFKLYQTKKEVSLRGIFGLPASQNYKNDKFEMFFNGFHKVDDVEDFIYHINLLRIDLI